MGLKINIACLGVSGAALALVATCLYRELLFAYEQTHKLSDYQYSWVLHLLLNLGGYSTVLLPGFLIHKYLQRINYFDKLGAPSRLSRALWAVFGEPAERLPAEGKGEPSARREAAELAFCLSGLLAAYLVWGLLQEKLMTQPYHLEDGSTVRFADSQLLVLVNRLLTSALAAAALAGARAPLAVPLRPLAYCALSNVVSAWCQYEALKYVSFPMQVLSKSCKVIPVMLMSKLVSGHKHAAHEYASAALISGGMVMFLLASQDDHAGGTVSLSSGIALLALYMCCDSFTSSWQARLLARTRAPPLQMVAGVSGAAALLAAAAAPHLPPRARAPPALLQHPQFIADVALLSLSSALGQLLIYRTIARFGAVAFTVIMTLRQAISILLSCLVYGHHISASGIAGVCVVFAAVLLRLYCRRRARPA